MSTLQNKIDFITLISVSKANCNGDPLNGNRPRTDYDNYGEISDVCIKRKIRNRMLDLGHDIFVQSDNKNKDGYRSLKERAENEIGKVKKSDNPEDYIKKACDKYLDVRSFGQLFAFGSNDESTGVSISVRGPVSICQAVSVSPVEIESIQITKSVNGSGESGMSSDRMGMKHMVRYGLYTVKGSINVQLAEKTGFTEEDAEVLKECIRTMFVNDSSSARPDGSMEVVKMYWFKHNSKEGQYSAAKVHRSIKVSLKDGVDCPISLDDYVISYESLDGLCPEIINGI